MYSGTAFYGINQIMMEYAGLPGFLPLPVAIQHGWQARATKFEANFSPPEIWVWSDRIRGLYEEFYPLENVRVTGSFFHYYLSLRERHGRHRVVEARSGSIVFPAHSTHYSRQTYSLEEMIRALQDLGDEYHPTLACLYYLDLKPDVVAAYEQQGIVVRTNGDLFSGKFIDNFYNNALPHKYCIYNEFGSAVLYAALLGLIPLRLGPSAVHVNIGNPNLEERHYEISNELERNYSSRLSPDLVRTETGQDSVISPDDLRGIILAAYRKIGVARSLKLFMSAIKHHVAVNHRR